MHKILKFYHSVEFCSEWNRYFETERKIKFKILRNLLVTKISKFAGFRISTRRVRSGILKFQNFVP